MKIFNLTTGLTVFELIIHLLHCIWMMVLWFSLKTNGGIALNIYLILTWMLAFIFEIMRWRSIGAEVHEIDGEYSLQRVIDKANEKFLNVSWYLMPIRPTEEYKKSIIENLNKDNRKTTLNRYFTEYWMDARLKYVMLLVMVPLASFYIFSGIPLTFGGALRSFPVSAAVAFFSFAILGKLLSIYSYCLYTHLNKGT